jgi:hypothetical protein
MGAVRCCRRRGQSALEAVMVVPLMLLGALGLIQLACAQQARLLLEAAAFHAARAGTVWSGHPGHMEDAARFALLPALGGTFDAAHLGQTWKRGLALDDALRAQGRFPDGWVRVEVLSPTEAEFPPDARGSPAPELELDGPVGKSGPPELRVRVRMLYELRIPFADAAIFWAFFAQRGGRSFSVPIVGTWSLPGDLGARAQAIGTDEGKPLASEAELSALWELSRGGLGGEPRYFLPFSATYRVRLQSNFYRRFLPNHGAP